MKKISFYSLLAALLLSCLFFACDMNAEKSQALEEEFTIALPQWPQNYPALSRWRIEIISAEKQERFYTTASSISVCTKKNRPFCITAQPLTLMEDGNECAYFKPAGYLYSTAETSLSWEAGFLAFIMKKLFFLGIDEGLSSVDIEYLISTFNWNKAQETIEKKLNTDSTLYYNPWLLSETKLLEGISAKSFKATLLNNSACAALPASELPENFLSTFIPENFTLKQKNQFTVSKNSPIIIGDGKQYGYFVTYKSAKNISLEPVFLPIYIEDI